MTSRPTNQELAANFRRLLTHGATDHFSVASDEVAGINEDTLLELTKPWRNELWQAFRAIEDRLDPLGALDREKGRKS